MSIRTGKQQYDSIAEFSERTDRELRDRDGVIFRRDTDPPEHERAFIRSQLTGLGSVLELGCGLGPWAKVAVDAGCRYVGVDPVRARITYCEVTGPAYPQAKFIHGDARTIRLMKPGFDSLEDVLFDAVLFVTVIQHLTLPDGIAALQTAAEHLRRGGKVVMIESMIVDASEEECERMYADPKRALHMVPKPLALLQAGEPRLKWSKPGEFGPGDRWVLTR